MITVIYTKHAVDKLKTKESKKFKITKQKIEKVVRMPLAQQDLPLDVIRIVGTLDKDHSLCVIYKNEDNTLKIITFFPAEKGRYEN